MNNNHKACCFLGHRKIELTMELRDKLYNIIEMLIIKNNVIYFLFGSKSQVIPSQTNSGTKLAYNYAMKKGIEIINVFR